MVHFHFFMGRSSVGSRSTPVLECISGMPSGSNPYDPQASSQGTTYFDILLAHLDRAVAFQATGNRFDSGKEQYLKSFRFSLTYFGGLAELVYCTGLENRRPRKGSGGSNPSASAIKLNF